jgi:hypothetical protein
MNCIVSVGLCLFGCVTLPFQAPEPSRSRFASDGMLCMVTGVIELGSDNVLTSMSWCCLMMQAMRCCAGLLLTWCEAHIDLSPFKLTEWSGHRNKIVLTSYLDFVDCGMHVMNTWCAWWLKIQPPWMVYFPVPLGSLSNCHFSRHARDFFDRCWVFCFVGVFTYTTKRFWIAFPKIDDDFSSC